MQIAYTKPSITQLEIDFATDAATNGWGEKCYDYIIRFEKEFSKHIGTDFGVATSSCTGAMTLGLKALGVGAGDEIILADTNWIATVSPIVHLGARPIFVDILESTWCLDPKAVEQAISTKTRAIVATHIYGNLCNMDDLLAIGEKYNIPVIEDAAEAIGSTYKGRPAGSMGLFSTFSFHGTKTLTTGEGGIFLTNDPSLYQSVVTLSNHGRAQGEKKQFWSERVGFKFKMSNIQAAIGCAQLERIDCLIKRKKEIFSFYKDAFADLTEISLNHELANCSIGAWMPTVVCSRKSGVKRERLLEEFLKEGIDARVFFWPLSSLPPFLNHPKTKNAYDIASRAINLPSFHDINDYELESVTEVIKKLCHP